MFRSDFFSLRHIYGHVAVFITVELNTHICGYKQSCPDGSSYSRSEPTVTVFWFPGFMFCLIHTHTHTHFLNFYWTSACAKSDASIALSVQTVQSVVLYLFVIFNAKCYWFCGFFLCLFFFFFTSSRPALYLVWACFLFTVVSRRVLCVSAVTLLNMMSLPSSLPPLCLWFLLLLLGRSQCYRLLMAAVTMETIKISVYIRGWNVHDNKSNNINKCS